MTLLELTPETYAQCVSATVEAFRANQLVLFPTDTVYGLGGKAFSRTVLNKLQKVKPNRPEKPTAVLIDNIIRMSQCAGDVPNQRIVKMAETFWPGPMTLIWKASSVIPDEFQTEDHSLGYRVPNHPYLLDVLREIEVPIWATSANLPAQNPPRLFAEVKEAVINACDLVIKTKDLLSGRASAVVDVRGKEPLVVRESNILEEDIRRVWKEA
jgi:L-threonylcarbamoyladenylate synthase